MPRSQFRLLVRLFTRRFFENDLLAPDIDLRPSAIWLVGALMTPSLLWSAKAIVRYGLLGADGYAVVEAASWFDKALLMTLAITCAGVVTLLCWEALLVDRRDALVLGTLPVGPWTIVAAKGTALLRIFGLVAALNFPAAAVFGVAVYGQFGLAPLVRALVAHAVAVSAASLATSLVVTVVLVGVTSLLTGRALRAVTTAVQVGVLAALTLVVFALQWTIVLGPAAATGDIESLGWLAAWPPLWFVGVYQLLLGAPTGSPLFATLARPALAASACAAIVCVPLTLVLWRRTLRVLLSTAPGEAASRAGLARRLLVRLARPGFDRGLLQFMFAVVTRSARHRLALVSAASLAAAVALEGVLVLAERPAGSARWLTEFASPLLVLLLLLSVGRWLLTVPAELPARWVLAMADPAPGPTVRRVVHRVLVVLAALPAVTLAIALSWWQAGPMSAMAHATLVLLTSLVLIELALARVTYMPFATEYVADRSNIKARWPVHAFVLLWIVPLAGDIERALVTSPGRPLAIVVAVMLAAVLWTHRRRRAGTDVLTAHPGTGAEWRPVELRIGAASSLM